MLRRVIFGLPLTSEPGRVHLEFRDFWNVGSGYHLSALVLDLLARIFSERDIYRKAPVLSGDNPSLTNACIARSGRNDEELAERIGTSKSLGRRDALVAALVPYALLAALYWPAQHLASRWVVPVRFADGAPPQVVALGDTLLVRPVPDGAQPARGALVAVRLRPRGGAVVLDRVLGLPGDLVELSRDGWTRNGVPLRPEELPLVAGPLPARIHCVVPPDGLFVWPSVNLRVYGNAAIDPAFGIQRRENLVGTAWRIASPFSRRGPVNAP